MKIRKIKSADKKQLLDFLSEYPYKDMQRRAQGLDNEKLADFHCKKILALAEKNESLIGISPHGDVLGIAILIPRPWHSSVFDIPMVKVSPFLLVHPDKNLKKRFLHELVGKIDTKKFKHTELRVDVNEWETIALLENIRFKLQQFGLIESQGIANFCIKIIYTLIILFVRRTAHIDIKIHARVARGPFEPDADFIHGP